MTQHTYSGSGSVLVSDTTIIFTGYGDALSLSHYFSPHDDMVFCYGTDQTVGFAGNGVNDKIIDLGKGLDLVTMGGPTVTVYDFQLDKTSHLTLLPFQHDTTAPDGHGGTMVSVFGGGPVAYGKIDFVGDTHVKVTHT